MLPDRHLEDLEVHFPARPVLLATAKKTCRKSEKPRWYAFEHIHVYMVYMYICIHIRIRIRIRIGICICICAVFEFKELYKEFDTARPGKLFASRQSDSFPVTICLANGDPKKSGKWIRWIRYGMLLNLFCMFLFQLDSEDSTEMSHLLLFQVARHPARQRRLELGMTTWKSEKSFGWQNHWRVGNVFSRCFQKN